AFDECLAVSRQTGNRHDIGFALLNLAETDANAGQFARAKGLYMQTLQIFKDIGEQKGAGDALSSLADIRAIQDDLTGAQAGEEEALAVKERIGAKGDAARSRVSLARIALEQGRASDAERLALQAAEDFHSQGVSSSEGEAYGVLADALRVQGKLNEAAGAVTNAQKLLANSDPISRAFVTIVDARVRAASGNHAEALTLLQDTVRQAKKAGWKDLEFQARLAL